MIKCSASCLAEPVKVYWEKEYSIMLTNEYLKRVYDGLAQRNANEPEFLQAVREVLESIQPVVEKHPEYEKAGLTPAL